MPTRETTAEQRADAARLKAIYDRWAKDVPTGQPKRTQDDVAEALGKGQSTVAQTLNGRLALNLERAAQLAKLFGCRVADFSPTLAAALNEPPALENLSSWRMSLADQDAGVDQLVSHQLPTVASTIRVPLLTVRASMGPGVETPGEEEMVRSLSLSPQWISNALRPSRAEALRFIHGHGDSMAPTFNSGDVLLVDTDVDDVSIPGIYVLEAQDQLFIKRVNRRLDGVFEISSDNPAHRTVETLNGDHEVSVKGRVIWVWNGRKM